MQIINSAKVYPVIVIGSGASGGMAAWNLTRQGIEVLLLDAGDRFDRSKFWTHVRPWEAQERESRGERAPQFFLDRTEQPYLTPDDRPFELTRVWGHGGKTNVWGRVSLRYSQMDLKAAERDGWEIPWPFGTPTSRLITTRSNSSLACAAVRMIRTPFLAASSCSRLRLHAAANACFRRAWASLVYR